jgi:hypothetical protein
MMRKQSSSWTSPLCFPPLDEIIKKLTPVFCDRLSLEGHIKSKSRRQEKMSIIQHIQRNKTTGRKDTLFGLVSTHSSLQQDLFLLVARK